MLRRINLGAAISVLICFFLPWIQVSCGRTSETLSGLSLARDEHPLLWLIPLLMLAVLTVGLVRSRREQPTLAAIIGAISGAVTALLMNRERMRVNDDAGIIAAQLTGWFWLGLISTLVIVATAVGLLVRRRPPD
jgi:predicted Co/Zn/Cd cation transporter (cation efflux family)